MRSRAELEAGLEAIRQSPADEGELRLIVRRPVTNERETLAVAELDLAEGLVGDRWKGSRGSTPENQITLMNARAAALVAETEDRWALAGDQLYVDLDLSDANLPPGTRLSVGEATLEVTAEPHNGCGKFRSRFGADSLQFVNSPVGKSLHLRGLYAKVITAGTIRQGDLLRKLS
jgi:MOSC domain-containing protein YiiM